MFADVGVRVRFAPSPTGYWHPGNARTALFVWLFARHESGSFILRIEDTDRTRNTPEAIANLLESMRWLGLDWDEGPEVGGPYGPYLQSERLHLYQAAAQELLSRGLAYYCFATPEELEAMRAEQRARGIAAPMYDGRYRDYPVDEALARVAAGERHAVRFRTPRNRTIVFDDAVRGRMEFGSDTIDDFVILKGDGFPVYNFACVVDDAAMHITHVIRAEEHLPNTPRQVLLYEALGHKLPVFGHLPLILNAKRQKLSKRDPGVRSVLDYRDEGILASAVVNHLALLGWSPRGDQEIMSLDELVRAFTLDRVSPSPSVFDVQKLERLGAEHLKRAPTEAVLRDALPFFQARGLCGVPPSETELATVRLAIDLLKTRAWNLRNLAESSVYLFTDGFPIDPAAARKRLLRSPAIPVALRAVASALEGLASWEPGGIEAAFRGAVEGTNVGAGEAIHAARIAVSGMPIGPGLFEILAALGRERCVRRLRSVSDQIEDGTLEARLG